MFNDLIGDLSEIGLFDLVKPLVDKVSVGPVNAYTFKEVTGEHVVEAIFVKQ